MTKTGNAIIASMTGSQLTGYAAGAAHVIWAVGTQKIVPTPYDEMKYMAEYTLPPSAGERPHLRGVWAT